MSKLTASVSSGALRGHPLAHVGARPLHRGLYVGQPLVARSAPRASPRVPVGTGLEARPPQRRGGSERDDEGEEQSEQPGHADHRNRAPDVTRATRRPRRARARRRGRAGTRRRSGCPRSGLRLSSSVRAPYAARPGRSRPRGRPRPRCRSRRTGRRPRARRRSGPSRRAPRRTRRRRAAAPASSQRGHGGSVDRGRPPTRDRLSQARQSAEQQLAVHVQHPRWTRRARAGRRCSG